MKVFIKTFFLFATLIVILLGVLIFCSNRYVNAKADFKTPKDIKYIVLGHSHPQCAFNDSLISGFLNLASGAEPYFFTFVKARKLVENNSGINTVFIEFSNNQAMIQQDNWKGWGKNYFSIFYERYSPFMTAWEKQWIVKRNISSFPNALLVSTKTNFNNIFTRDLNYVKKVGGYNYLAREITDSAETTKALLRNSFIKIRMEQDKIPNENITFLRKIIDLCRQNNKKVVLVRCPVRSDYPPYANEAVFKKILATEFKDVEFLDFKNFALRNNELADIEHLNFRGAKRFSIWFDKLLKSGLLQKTNKQEFIDQVIGTKDHDSLEN